ncbi:hypothetical protein T03_362 [Trichinella britovi]|uniref:Uncharacterized protein n=1 Tax=Trichinella britovi TaxID=45882 RepID=A0A0V1APG4_TRIBR|nr:hypothetical protein T03_13993 [Trichinella britovi]KRY26680.1 hypothetical protein T03_362 [Trichinella britovi]
MLHIKQPANHKWSATNIVQDECTEESIRNPAELLYRYQYVCAASLNSPANLLSNGELLKLNHRISIDHETCGGVLMVSNVFNDIPAENYQISIFFY